METAESQHGHGPEAAAEIYGGRGMGGSEIDGGRAYLPFGRGKDGL